MSDFGSLGLTYNIIQAISFTREIITLCKQVYEGHPPIKDLREYANSIGGIAKEVRQGISNLETCTVSQEKLVKIAQRCIVASRELQEEVQFILKHDNEGSLIATLRIVAKSNWRKKRLARLTKDVLDWQTALETGLLARVCKQTDAIEIQQKEEFQRLNENWRYFIDQFSTGSTTLSDLVLNSTEIINSHTSKTAEDIKTSLLDNTQQIIDGAVERLEKASIKSTEQFISEEQRQKFLAGLKFEGMNNRKNQLRPAHSNTYKWIFGVSDNDAKSHVPAGNSTLAVDQHSNQVSQPWDDFLDWLKSTDSIYWIQGKPGSGKSTLMKYIIANEATRHALRMHNTDIHILSHFLWKAGSLLQKSFRGICSSLLHQLLSADRSLIEQSLLSTSDPSSKTDITDWSDAELEQGLHTAIRFCSSFLCIFIDGLDECDERNGPVRTLHLIKTLAQLPDLKLCVASRAESFFETGLQSYPQLRLQDLTEPDIKIFIMDSLKESWEKFGVMEDARQQTICRLCTKAEGVFLWIYLVVEQLELRIGSDVPYSELFNFLDELPTELSNLYMDMWQRRNGRGKADLVIASRYINLVLEQQRMRLIARPVTMYLNPINESQNVCPLSLLELAILTEPRVGALFPKQQPIILKEISIESQERVEDGRLHNICADVERDVKFRCAGLISFAPAPKSSSLFPQAVQISNLQKEIDFIHRSAYDFLVETPEGQQIRTLHEDSSPNKRMEIIRAKLLSSQLTIDGWEKMYNNVLVPLSQIATDDCNRDDIYGILDICKFYYEEVYNRHMDKDYPINLYIELIIRSQNEVFKEYALQLIDKSQDPATVATNILRDSFDLIKSYHTTESLKGLRRLIESLLSKGADPNKVETVIRYRTPLEFSLGFLRSPITILIAKIMEYDTLEDSEAAHYLDLFQDMGAVTTGYWISMEIAWVNWFCDFRPPVRILGTSSSYDPRHDLVEANSVYKVTDSQYQPVLQFHVTGNTSFWMKLSLQRVNTQNSSHLLIKQFLEDQPPQIRDIYVSSSFFGPFYSIRDHEISFRISQILTHTLALPDRTFKKDDPLCLEINLLVHELGQEIAAGLPGYEEMRIGDFVDEILGGDYGYKTPDWIANGKPLIEVMSP